MISNYLNSHIFLYLQPSRSAWEKVFYLAAGIYAFGSVFYILFSSGEEQLWAKREAQGEGEEDVEDEEENGDRTVINC